VEKRAPRRLAIVAVCVAVVASALVAASATHAPPAEAAGPTLANGFVKDTVFSNLFYPTQVQFASDGRVFVAEKFGVVRVFSSLNATSPTMVADLRRNVYDYGDRGLLGMALDPQFPTRPYIYLLYSLDAPIGGTPPHYGDPNNGYVDTCPTPPGLTTDGCVTGSRLSRITISGNTMVPGSEQVLVEDWCEQFDTHSIGTVRFGPDGALYAGGGDGASYLFVDYGQAGIPKNPCGDPPVGTGGTQTPPSALGGALRSQSPRRPSGPVSLDGTIIRVNPDTGAAMPDNPNAAAADGNVRRIVAYGMRNPYRFTFRPGTNELWIGDVGWNTAESIYTAPNPTGEVRNFGWPCYEGAGAEPEYQAAGFSTCQSLYTSGTRTPPFFSYLHTAKTIPNDTCSSASGAITSVAFHTGGNWPAKYDGALFFSDYVRNCIYTVLPGADGKPDATRVERFASGFATGNGGVVSMEQGPGNDLYLVDMWGGTISRIRYVPTSGTPVATLDATPRSGSAPLDVTLDASESVDPGGSSLTYSWDFDGDGVYDADSANPIAHHTYTTPGYAVARVRVRNSSGVTSTASVTITVGIAPSATIISPAHTTTWKVGDTIHFSGQGVDNSEGPLPASDLTWTITLLHCPNDACHTHPITTLSGVSSGDFVAPDHDNPSKIVIKLEVHNSNGIVGTDQVTLSPATSRLSVRASFLGARVSAAQQTDAAPYTLNVIKGSRNTVSAPNQRYRGVWYRFSKWSDGGARSHDVIVDGNRTVRASFTSSIVGPLYKVASTGQVSAARKTIPSGARVSLRGDTARGFAALRNGGVVLDSRGHLHQFGTATVPSGAPSFPGSYARGIAMNGDGKSGYVLDAFGGLHPLGGAAPVLTTPYWPGADNARGVVLAPSSTRTDPAGYILDLYGGIHPFGDVAAPTGAAYWPGFDIARSIAANPGGPGGWVLDGFGGVHPFGGAPALSGAAYWPGWDIARSLVVAAPGKGWVLDGLAGVHPLGSAPIAPGGASYSSDRARFLALGP
jgi:glucose/arabinose dehydrogenase